MRNLNKHEIQVIDILLKKKTGHFTYPGELEMLSHNKITRLGASGVCERLTNSGIFHSEKKRSPTHSKPTSHYRFGKDKKSFIILV